MCWNGVSRAGADALIVASVKSASAMQTFHFVKRLWNATPHHFNQSDDFGLGPDVRKWARLIITGAHKTVVPASIGC